MLLTLDPAPGPAPRGSSGVYGQQFDLLQSGLPSLRSEHQQHGGEELGLLLR